MTVPKWDASVVVKGINILEGDDEILTIELTPGKATGVVHVDIDGVGYYANITDGKATLTVKDLKKGTYPVKVRYLGDDVYDEAVNETTVTVSDALDIDVDGKGNDSAIVIEIPENKTGNVTVLIDGKEYEAVVDANGTVTIQLENITPGEHNVTVIYKDSECAESVVSSTINVPKWDASIKAESEDINVGDTEVITVTGPSDYDGDAVVNLNDIDYHVYLTAGKGTLNVKDLPAGNYTALVTYMENDKYLEANTTTSF